VTGVCNKLSCPLANSRYATVREEEGVIYLYVKTIERAHSPARLWEKIELNGAYTKALGQIDEHLVHWPSKQVHIVKQRLTRLHQYLIRMKKILTRTSFKLVHGKNKYHKRELAREERALTAARLDFAIKKELLDRLKNRTYGDLYNLNERVFNQVMDKHGENEVEFVEATPELDAELEAEAQGEDIEDIELNEGEMEEEEDEDEEMEMEDDDGELEMEMENEGEGQELEMEDMDDSESDLDEIEIDEDGNEVKKGKGKGTGTENGKENDGRRRKGGEKTQEILKKDIKALRMKLLKKLQDGKLTKSKNTLDNKRKPESSSTFKSIKKRPRATVEIEYEPEMAASRSTHSNW